MYWRGNSMIDGDYGDDCNSPYHNDSKCEKCREASEESKNESEEDDNEENDESDK